ncbi:MAG: RluA family pseudouridine synthase [Phycisphaerae bacterium]|nr:RluA family pseudouridine synthase [Phycisphaerae bacterium]
MVEEQAENQDVLREDEAAAVTEDGGPVRASLEIRHRRSHSRIDKYLQGRFPRFSRTAIQKLIKEGAITVNAKPTKASYEINPGDKIDLILPPLESKEIKAENIPLEILFEDPYLVAVNKPANMVSHPARGYQSGTLVNAMMYYCQQLSKSDDPIRPGIVHRLDKDTTGVIVLAKDDEAHWRLALQFERRKIYKEYLAVVEGELELDSDRIVAAIGTHPSMRERYAVREGVGRHAATVYQVVERLNGFTFVRLVLETGRTHQIRVHMSHLRHPIVGDTLYGARRITVGQLFKTDDETPIMPRFALHAHKIQFRHPITGQDIVIQAPLPADMENLLELLRKRKK